MSDPVPLPPAEKELPSHSMPEETFLLRYLQSHDVACPLCQYNLRNLTVPRCPECGREIKLTVGMVEPFLLPWILTTIFMAMAAGIGVLFVIGCVVFGPPHFGSMSSRDIPPCVSVVWGVVAIPLTLVLVMQRRSFFRMERQAQWSLAGVVLLINVGLVVLTFASLR